MISADYKVIEDGAHCTCGGQVDNLHSMETYNILRGRCFVCGELYTVLREEVTGNSLRVGV